METKHLVWFAVPIVGLFAFAIAQPQTGSVRQQSSLSQQSYVATDPIRDCYKKGVAYYKEIGSYPFLSDGREAEEVAVEKCGRSPVAFN